VMNPLLSCVAENDAAWFRRVQNLVLSLRWFGGSLSEARFIAHFVGDAAPEYRRALGDLGAEVRVVERVDSRLPLTNKLRMLELHGEVGFDVLVALDCDVVVVDDFAAQLSASGIGAKPVDYDLFSEREWQRLYGTVGLSPPGKTLRATSSGKQVGPYFNTGVLTVPRALCGEVRRRWGECHSRLVAQLQRDPDTVRRDLAIYQEQVALALAIAGGPLPWVALPVGMNFPCHVPVHPSALSASPSPAILHYHDLIDADGFLLRPKCSVAADPAHRFNSRRAEHLSLAYSRLRSPPAWESIRTSAGDRLRRIAGRRHRIRAQLRDLSARRLPL
jgi:hypothetical protein